MVREKEIETAKEVEKTNDSDNQDETKMPKSTTKGWSIATVLFFLMCAGFVAIGIYLYNCFDSWPKENKDTFVAIYASVSGSFCALIGVLVSIIHDRTLKENEEKRFNKPELFIPCKFDLNVAEKIPLFIDGKRIPNITKNNCFFQNSEKVAFKIESVKYNGYVFMAKDFFVEKGKLFSLNFEKKYIKNYNGHFEMIVWSLCGVPYKVVVDTEKRTVNTNELSKKELQEVRGKWCQHN